VGRKRHPRASSWSAAADHGQQHLNTEAVPAIWLKDLQAGFVIEFLTGQGVGDVLAHVIVPNAPCIRIAVSTLPDLR
jgi:hypothetical protein